MCISERWTLSNNREENKAIWYRGDAKAYARSCGNVTYVISYDTLHCIALHKLWYIANYATYGNDDTDGADSIWGMKHMKHMQIRVYATFELMLTISNEQTWRHRDAFASKKKKK